MVQAMGDIEKAICWSVSMWSGGCTLS